MFHSSPRSPRRAYALHGFSLIELLVVIAIISLLVSILLPSLNKAKDLARTAVCLSNQRGLGSTLFMYAEENEGRFPPGHATGWSRIGLDPLTWINFLINSEHLNGTFGNDKLAESTCRNYGIVYDCALLQCPSLPYELWWENSGYGLPVYPSPEPLVLDMYSAGQTHQPDQPPIRGRPIGDIHSPSNRLMLTDSAIPNNMSRNWFTVPVGREAEYLLYGIEPVSLWAADKRHGGGEHPNVLFADSHAESISWEDFVGNKGGLFGQE